MAYWDDQPAAKENLRMFEAPNVWRRYADSVEDETTLESGCAERLESVLINGLNATNVLLLTGAGSSYGATNDKGSSIRQKTAPGLSDLWDAVKTGVGEAVFNSVIQTIPNGSAIGDIEKLLTQCKLFVALYGSVSTS